MVLMRHPVGRAVLATGAWTLLASVLAGQGPAYGPGYPSAGSYGSITSTFGVTGLGTGPYGISPPLSLGTSGGGGGGLNRYGRMTSLVDQEPQHLLSRPFPEEDVAHLGVIVPTRDAELWVNDTLMTKQGTSRSVISPFLTPGKHFLYDVKVRYKERDGRVVEQSRSIVVQAGSSDIVDFRREVSLQSPARLGK